MWKAAQSVIACGRRRPNKSSRAARQERKPGRLYFLQQSLFSGRTIFKVVPVKVWYDNPSKYVCTYAFIDERSSVNMCSAELAERLGVPVEWGNVELITANAITHEKKKVYFLAIQGIEENAFMIKDAFVQDSIFDVSFSIPKHEMIKNYSHLRDLKFPKIENQKIELLLGSDLHQTLT